MGFNKDRDLFGFHQQHLRCWKQPWYMRSASFWPVLRSSDNI